MPKSIFISYSDADRNKMRSFERQINKTTDLKAIIIADNRQATKLLSEKVKSGIIECDYFAPILTRSSIATQWINQEIGFATGINKPMYPIVEESIMSNLRGFIHKQVDLPYSFKGNQKNGKGEAAQYLKTARRLVNDLLWDNNKAPKDLNLEDLFPGKWESTFNINGNIFKEEKIEIKDKTKFYVGGKIKFNLSQISIDVTNKILKFTKTGTEERDLVIQSRLEIFELGKTYVGLEDNNKIGKNISITYRRIE